MSLVAIPVEKNYEGHQRTYTIPEVHCRKGVPVRFYPAAMGRLCELTREDDYETVAEAETDLKYALRAEL